MEEVLINGEIYIKIKPHYIYPDKEKIEELEKEIYNIEFEEADKGITPKTIIKKQSLIELKNRILKPKIDNRYMKNFHIMEINENTITMKTFDILGEKEEQEYQTIEEINNEYIKLSTFLKEAEYIGKEFVRTKPLIINKIKDISYITEDPYSQTTVLYKTEYAMLVEYKGVNSRNLEMLEPMYFKDNNYKLIGNTYNSKDKKEIYKEILEEIMKRTNYYKKYKKSK